MKSIGTGLAAVAALSLAGCVGYGYPSDGYYGGGYPSSGGYYPGDGYGYGQHGRDVVRCESDGHRTRHCAVDTRGGVRITRQLSDAACVQGRSWGTDRNGVWVTQGCRAEFAIGGGYGPGYGSRSGHGGSGRTIRCESNDRRQRRCNADVRNGVDVVRQLSDTRCVHGRNWGWDRGGVWVDGGCRAEFRIR